MTVAYFISNETLNEFGTPPEWLTMMGFPHINHTIRQGRRSVEGVVLNRDVLDDWRQIFTDPPFDLEDSGEADIMVYKPAFSGQMESGRLGVRFRDEHLRQGTDAIQINTGLETHGQFVYKPSGVSLREIRENYESSSRVYIHINMVPVNEEDYFYPDPGQVTDEMLVDAPETLYGIPIPAGAKLIRPSTLGMLEKNIESPEGVVVAQTYGQHVFVLTPLAIPFMMENQRSSKILKEILKGYANINPWYSKDEIPVDRFTEITRQVLQAEQRNANDQEREASRRANDLQEQLGLVLRDLHRYRTIKNALDHANPSRESVEREIAMIRNNQDIEAINFRPDGKILVRTRRIIWEDPDPNDLNRDLARRGPANGVRFRDFGHIRIEINPKEFRPDHAVRWFNETISEELRPEGHQIPHVTRNGTACLGNFTEMLAQVVGQNQIAMLIQLAVRFAEEANLQDAYGIHARGFPAYYPETETNDAEEAA